MTTLEETQREVNRLYTQMCGAADAQERDRLRSRLSDLVTERDRLQWGRPVQPPDASIDLEEPQDEKMVNEILRDWDTPAKSVSSYPQDLTDSPETNDTKALTHSDTLSQTVRPQSDSLGKTSGYSLGKTDASEQQAESAVASVTFPSIFDSEKDIFFSGDFFASSGFAIWVKAPVPDCQEDPVPSDIRDAAHFDNEVEEARHAESEARSLGSRDSLPTPSKKAWDRLSLSKRLPFYELAIEGENAHAFTLDLSPHIQAKAKADERGPADYLRRRIDYQLKKHLDARPEYFFGAEISDSGNLHLHGVIEVPANDMRKSVETALRAAGDVLPDKSEKHGYQKVRHFLDLKPFYRDRWSNYIMKSRHRDSKKLAGRSFYITAALRNRAKLLYRQVSRS